MTSTRAGEFDCAGDRSRYGRPPATALALVLACVLVAQARQAAAQAAGAMASVNDKGANGVTLSQAGNAKPDADGLSLAGTKAFHPVTEEYQISAPLKAARNPNKAPSIELKNMQGMIGTAQMLINLNNKLNAAQQTAAAKMFAATALQQLKPVGTDFNAIGKAKQILDTGEASASNDKGAVGGKELATAEAMQNAVANPKVLNTTGTTVSVTATKGTLIGNPLAAAYAVNIDPSPITWDSPSVRTSTLDLSHVTLTAATTGTGSSAAATLGLQADFVNGTDDVTTPQSSASSLFTLNLGLFSFDGAASTAVTDLSFLGSTPTTDPGGLAISDSLGNSGLTQVAADLSTEFVALGGGTFGFLTGFSITFNVPGTSADTLLFYDEFDGAAAAVPEPGSMALLAVAALALAGRALGRRARA